MIKDEFRNVESALSRIKRRYRNREISKREFLESLKKLRVRDQQGRFWMIGVQTGKWYFFDGRKWTPSSPPSFREEKAVCIHCGLENDLDTDVCARCGGAVDGAAEDSRNFSETDTDDLLEKWEKYSGDKGPTGEGSLHVLRSFKVASVFLIFGTAGAFFGFLAGVLAGSTTFFPGFSEYLPEFLRDIQGKLLGGLLFAAGGGVLGFAASGAAGWIAAHILNGILSLSGGLRFRAARIPEE